MPRSSGSRRRSGTRPASCGRRGDPESGHHGIGRHGPQARRPAGPSPVPSGPGGRTRGAHALQDHRASRPHRVDGRVRRLGHRRDLGHRHRRRRRSQRCTPPSISASPSSTPPTSMAMAAANGSSPGSAGERPDADITVATKAGRRLVPHDAAGYNPGNLDPLRRSQPHQSPHRVPRTPPAPLSAHRRVLPPRGLRRPRRPRRASKARSLYGVSVELIEEAEKAILHPNVPSRPDHLQHLPPPPRRAVPPQRHRRRRRRHRPGPARQRAAQRADNRQPRLSPPTTTGPSTGTASPSTSGRPSPASPTRTGSPRSMRSARWSPRAGPWPSWRCAGS